jgi:copper chaperone CopZ
VRVVVGKIDGVQSVNVSLKDGIARIRFAPANRVSVAKIRDAIRSNGFTARDAEISVAGSVIQRGDTLTLVVPGSDESFVLQDAPGGENMIAEIRRRLPVTRIAVAGQLPAPLRGNAGPMRILVRALSSP